MPFLLLIEVFLPRLVLDWPPDRWFLFDGWSGMGADMQREMGAGAGW
jgi:hypothetical protein